MYVLLSSERNLDRFWNRRAVVSIDNGVGAWVGGALLNETLHEHLKHTIPTLLNMLMFLYLYFFI